MADLKKYTSFEALKGDEKSTLRNLQDNVFTEFEVFLRQLHHKYSENKRAKIKMESSPTDSSPDLKNI